MMTFLGLCHAFLSHKVGLRDKSKELLHGLDITIVVLIHILSNLRGKGQNGWGRKRKGGGVHFSLPSLPFLHLQTASFQADVCVKKKLLTIEIYNKGSDVRICSVIICLLLSDFSDPVIGLPTSV